MHNNIFKESLCTCKASSYCRQSFILSEITHLNIKYLVYYSDCASNNSICQTCQSNGQKFVEEPLRACSRCINSGIQCVKLLVLAWSADCEENNKQAMLKLIQEKTGGTLPPKLHFLLPIPEATHVAKCLKGSFSNWFLNKGGERFNLSNLRTLYNDPNPAIREKMRSVVTLSAVRNRDRMSVPDLLTINKESVRVLLASVPRITQTLIPSPTVCTKETREVLSTIQPIFV